MAHGAPQVDLLYLHNAAEMQLEDLGKRRFVERLAAAFREMERLRCETVPSDLHCLNNCLQVC